jgi:hypothetical protein
MRLINVDSMLLEEFVGGGSHVPGYAILSHTWEDGEVTFQDFTNLDNNIKIHKKGFAKIKKTCDLAKQDGLKYAWIDTCCIDKSSSAELTEAINSMFQWYRASVVCYTWFADLPNSGATDNQPARSSLSKCRWFKRGWTLQELIAPKLIKFYDQGWNFCGTKSTLKAIITNITGIESNVLDDSELLANLSVAKRMSWAATRQTTRTEDMAYCLLGIFDVNMPMLYGEGMRAFLRLQEEIVKETNDLSIFAWRADRSVHKYSGIFAATPTYFRESGSVELENDTVFNPEFLLTNKGLRMTRGLSLGANGAYLLKLNCVYSEAAGGQHIGIWIKPHGGGVYSRTEPSEFAAEIPGADATSHDIFLLKWIGSARAQKLEGSHNKTFMLRQGFNTLDVIHAPHFPFYATVIMPKEEWDHQRGMFLTHGAAEFSGLFFFVARNGTISTGMTTASSFLLAFGKTSNTEVPWVTIMTPYEHQKAFSSLGGDLAKTVSEIRKHQPRKHVRMRDDMGRLAGQVSVRVENEVVDGQEVYCLDLVYVSDLSVLTDDLRQDTSENVNDVSCGIGTIEGRPTRLSADFDMRGNRHVGEHTLPAIGPTGKRERRYT